MPNLRSFTATLLPGLAFLGFWQWLTHADDKRQFFFSSPSRILSTFIQDTQTSELWINIAYTSLSTVTGLIIGTISGTLVALCMWSSPRFSRLSQPYLVIIGSIPVFALAPMLILWFGIGIWSKIIMASFAVFLVALAQAYEGIQTTAKHYLLYAQSLDAPLIKQMRHILIPGAVAWIRSGIKMNISIALTASFIAEFISSQHGLGHYILKAGGLYDMPRVFTGLVLMATLSAILHRIAK